jgi:hypothetical protein
MMNYKKFIKRNNIEVQQQQKQQQQQQQQQVLYLMWTEGLAE